MKNIKAKIGVTWTLIKKFKYKKRFCIERRLVGSLFSPIILILACAVSEAKLVRYHGKINAENNANPKAILVKDFSRFFCLGSLINTGIIGNNRKISPVHFVRIRSPAKIKKRRLFFLSVKLADFSKK
jgi:hypothetical protein